MDYHLSAYGTLAESLTAQGVDLDSVKAALMTQHIETPSWGYGNCGTRFRVFPWPGAARDVYEKLADAALVHKLTGIASSVALHIPWDKPARGGIGGVNEWIELKQYAQDLGIRIGAINPNVFQDEHYRLGSFCNPDAAIRRQAIDHMLECIEVMEIMGSDVLSLWFADGTNYAGQDSFRARKHRMEESLAEVYAALPQGCRMLIEYKFFEPAFYHTDIPDWGVAVTMAHRLGPQAQVLVDIGHHAPGTNIEYIVAFLLDEEMLGGFHLNSRKYADDDLIVGTVNPFELFCIFNELVAGEQADDPGVAERTRNVAFMIDQSHNVEGKIAPMIVSVLNCQVAYAKALLVDQVALAERQAAGDVLGAHRVLVEAYETDVRPLLAQVRVEMGLDPDPLAAFEAGGYADKLARERGVATGDGSGYEGA